MRSQRSTAIDSSLRRTGYGIISGTERTLGEDRYWSTLLSRPAFYALSGRDRWLGFGRPAVRLPGAIGSAGVAAIRRRGPLPTATIRLTQRTPVRSSSPLTDLLPAHGLRIVANERRGYPLRRSEFHYSVTRRYDRVPR